MKKLNPYQRFIAATSKKPAEVTTEKTEPAIEAAPQPEPETEIKETSDLLFPFAKEVDEEPETENAEEPIDEVAETEISEPKHSAKAFNFKKK